MSVIDRPLFKLSPLTTTAPVALVQSALGDDGRILSVITAAGYRGLIIEVLGGGSVPPGVDCEARAACPCHTRGLQPTNVLRAHLEIHLRQHWRRTQSAPNGHYSQRFTGQFEVAAAPSTVADHRSRRGRTRACIRHVRRTPNHRRPPRIPGGARRGEGLSTRALSVNQPPAAGCWIDNTAALASLPASTAKPIVGAQRRSIEASQPSNVAKDLRRFALL